MFSGLPCISPFTVLFFVFSTHPFISRDTAVFLVYCKQNNYVNTFICILSFPFILDTLNKLFIIINVPNVVLV